MVDMPISLIPSFLLYCFVGDIPPGPANLCSLGAALRCGRGPGAETVAGDCSAAFFWTAWGGGPHLAAGGGELGISHIPTN